MYIRVTRIITLTCKRRLFPPVDNIGSLQEVFKGTGTTGVTHVRVFEERLGLAETINIHITLVRCLPCKYQTVQQTCLKWFIRRSLESNPILIHWSARYNKINEINVTYVDTKCINRYCVYVYGLLVVYVWVLAIMVTRIYIYFILLSLWSKLLSIKSYCRITLYGYLCDIFEMLYVTSSCEEVRTTMEVHSGHVSTITSLPGSSPAR